MKASDLQTLRHAIDGTDEAITALLASRRKLSHQIIALKARDGVPPLDVVREAEIRRRYDLMARGSGSVAHAILNWCRRHA